MNNDITAHKGMQNKTMVKLLDQKINDWIDSIKNYGEGHESLKLLSERAVKAIKKDCIVTGGSIASMAMGEKINDFDIYLRTKQSTIAIAEFYTELFKIMNPNKQAPSVREENVDNILGEREARVVLWVSSSGMTGTEEESEEDIEHYSADLPNAEPEEEKPRYRPTFLSENAITLSNKIQIVIRFYGEPDQIHRNYDFVHAMCYFDYKSGVLSTPVKALRAMQSRTLYYEGSLYPVCSLFRCRKFIKRGWNISAGEMLKIVLQISNINLTDIPTLREQLTGVDAAYFHMLISAVKEKELQGEEIDNSYIVEVINRIFNDSEKAE